MPSKKTLLVSLVVLVLLGGIYGVLVATSEPVVNEEEIYATTGMSSEAMTLTEIDPRTVMFATIECGHGDVLDLEYTVQGWKVVGNPDIPLDDDIVETIINPLCEVKSDRLLSEDPSVKAEYGLDPARFKVTLTDSSDNVYTFNIGEKHPTTYKYYFNIEGEDKIYTVPTGVAMNLETTHSVGSLIKAPYFPAPDAASTAGIVVETGDQRMELVHLPAGSEDCWTTDYTWFYKLSDGTMIPLDEAEFSYFTNVIAGMGFLETVDYSDDPAVLAQYGLVEGKQHKISISYESAQRGSVTDVIYIGLGENGTTYARVDGSWVIGSIVNKFDYFSFPAEKYQAHDFCKLQLATVDSMTVTLDGTSHKIDVESNVEVGADGKENTVASFHYNGKKLDGNRFVTFFNSLRNTSSEGVAEGTPEGTPYMTITFDRNTANYKQMTLKVWEYDSNFYVSEFAGSTVLVNKNDINTIVTALTTALESEAA